MEWTKQPLASLFVVMLLSTSFSPELLAEPIAFPKTDPASIFVIAQSFIAADKRATGPVCYNLRVAEYTLAAEYRASQLNLKLGDDSSPLGRSLYCLQNAYFRGSRDLPGSEYRAFEQMNVLVEGNLTKKKDIAAKK